MNNATQRPIPTREDWGDLSADPEVEYGYSLFGGKTREEAVPLFIENPVERAAELRFTPSPVFNYYIFCFADYLLSPQAQGASDAASCFLRLVRDRVQLDPEGISAVYPELESAIEGVARQQAFYDADEGIYGSFLTLRQDIASAWATGRDRG